MKKFTVIFFLLLAFQISAQEFRIKKGIVVDSIPVNDSIGESFALYLPRNFQANNTFPIIFLFDPDSRGKSAAQLFKTAAENQGYVIAASNNISSEKTLAENITSATHLIDRVTSMIPFDPNSVSVGGFSEGASVAIALPVLYNNILGVLAVGNHQLNFKMLEKLQKFMFVAVTGNEEMASYGANLTVEDLNVLGFPAVAYSFQGGHEWPDANLISSALGSLTLHAMKKNLRPKNSDLVNELYQQDISRVNKLISTGNYIEAQKLLEVLYSKYEGFKELSEIKDKMAHLLYSRNFQEQKFKFDKVEEKENQLLEDYLYYFNQDIATANFENVGWWNYQKLQLDEYKNSKNEAEVIMGNRLTELLNELAKFKLKELQKSEAPLEQRLLANMLQTVFDPTNFEAYKNVISLSTIDNDFSTALFYLEEMLKNGYKDAESLYEIDGTLGLKLTPEYNWLIEKYLGKAQFYEGINPVLKSSE